VSKPSRDGAPPFRRLLVANRGEIAVRIIRAAHALGIPAVAVFSEADRKALHVRYADAAACIGPPEPRRSYLDIDRILDVATRMGCDSVHPGYGFLAENAEFARASAAAGLVFIGPPPGVIEAMGDKLRARALMEAAGVPVVPGSGAVDPENLAAQAAAVGYPLLLKASAGGGGKGIRTVHEPGQLRGAFDRAQGEARTAFGDDTLYLERLLEGPHHIEIQIFGDSHGSLVHLHERECSVQRRHQKLVEETPSPFLTPALREAMGRAAVDAARAIGYVGAGTVEFLVDAGRRFYFLEVNTRLQVEHPVTEMVTGLDLVQEQIRVAAGAPLSFTQSTVRPRGHAIEVRVCAEDPDNGFLPSIGRIDDLALPGGPGIRVDSALFTRLEVSLHYDSLLAKLVAWGADRSEALARLRQALSEFKIADLKTNIAFLGRVVRSEAFTSGDYDTGLAARLGSPDAPEVLVEAAAVAAAVGHHLRAGAGRAPAAALKGGADPWKSEGRRRGLRGRP
jgi:acetyl-CoA carboxylase biotin carboxylase subunit